MDTQVDEKYIDTWKKLLHIIECVSQERPGDKSEEDQRYSVIITDLERVMSFYYAMVLLKNAT